MCVGHVHVDMHTMYAFGVQRDHAIDSPLAETCRKDAVNGQRSGAVNVVPIQPLTSPVFAFAPWDQTRTTDSDDVLEQLGLCSM